MMRYHVERKDSPYFPQDDDVMTDCMDGTAWQEKMINEPRMRADPRNAAVILCGDGVCPFNMLKNKKTMYVFQLMIANLAPWLRKMPQWMTMVFVVPGSFCLFFFSTNVAGRPHCL